MYVRRHQYQQLILYPGRVSIGACTENSFVLQDCINLDLPETFLSERFRTAVEEGGLESVPASRIQEGNYPTGQR